MAAPTVSVDPALAAAQGAEPACFASEINDVWSNSKGTSWRLGTLYLIPSCTKDILCNLGQVIQGLYTIKQDCG